MMQACAGERRDTDVISQKQAALPWEPMPMASAQAQRSGERLGCLNETDGWRGKEKKSFFGKKKKGKEKEREAGGQGAAAQLIPHGKLGIIAWHLPWRGAPDQEIWRAGARPDEMPASPVDPSLCNPHCNTLPGNLGTVTLNLFGQTTPGHSKHLTVIQYQLSRCFFFLRASVLHPDGQIKSTDDGSESRTEALARNLRSTNRIIQREAERVRYTSTWWMY
jgi:hypothetical protein